MQISANILLDAGDTLDMTLDEAAAAFIAALNGDPATDYATVTIAIPQGSAGAAPTPPGP